jgi:diadenosine tetraphosphate (Ap4A) HIT family hydrolase
LTTYIHKCVELARNGQNPKVIARMASGWAVLGGDQFFRGYSLLLPDPVVPTLNDLPQEQRARFLLDMAALGDAILAVTDALRINYEMLGNLEVALHAHCFPRYASEDPEFRVKPIWLYDEAKRSGVPFSQDEHGPLKAHIRAHLEANGLIVE